MLNKISMRILLRRALTISAIFLYVNVPLSRVIGNCASHVKTGRNSKKKKNNQG